MASTTVFTRYLRFRAASSTASLASPSRTRYPYVYPRDTSSAVAFFRRVACSPRGYDAAPLAYELMESMARFLKKVWDREKGWGQRYDSSGRNKSIYKQEDNLAHGIAVLCNYLLAASELGKEVQGLDQFLACINEAAGWSLEHLYHRELNLFRSTTAIHESALEQGYTCWVNFSFLYAFSLADEVARKIDTQGIISPSHLSFRRHFLYSISELFISGNRYVRRIDRNGQIDLRPDITLMSPFYYGFLHYRSELENSIRFVEKSLWDPELNMIMRFLPFDDDFDIHVHAGNGPWIPYTAILAQYHYWNGNFQRGDELLEYIDRYRGKEGELPEHISTCRRFAEFMESEWKTGIDFAKEFHPPILCEQADFDVILEEANNMARSYRDTARFCMLQDEGSPGGGYIQFTLPLLWSHVEYARALLIRNRDWWKLKEKH